MTAWQNRIVGQGVKPADQFQANPNNWRKHPMAQREALRGVLNEVGWVQQVIENVRTGHLVDGHERVWNALQNDNAEVPYIQVDLSEADEALVLATLDPIGAMATTDAAQLDALLHEVQTGDAAVQTMLAELAQEAGLYQEPKADPGAQVDKAAELQEKWQTERGQLWQIGKHRLLCGDSTSREDVARLMGGMLASLLFTSPPYWVGKDYETQGSETEIDHFIASCVRAWTDWVRVDEGRVVVNTGTAAIHRIEKKRKVEVLPLIDKWANSLRQRGWLLRHIRIWAKAGDLPALVAPKTDVVDQHWEHLALFENETWEYIGAFWSPAGHQRGQERIKTAWAQQGVWAGIAGERSAGGTHVAAFPIEIPFRHIILYTKQGESVLDPFLGSGTTMVACEQQGRVCYGMEIEPKYVAVTLERMAGMGLEPVCAGVCNGGHEA